MNSSDFKLITFIILIVIIGFLFLLTNKQEVMKEAYVFYDNDLVLTIDLSNLGKREYIVQGDNGDVVIEVDNGKIRVIDEKSPLHLCSKTGWISEAYQTIICLPNKIVIEINKKNEIDTIIE